MHHLVEYWHSEHRIMCMPCIPAKRDYNKDFILNSQNACMKTVSTLRKYKWTTVQPLLSGKKKPSFYAIFIACLGCDFSRFRYDFEKLILIASTFQTWFLYLKWVSKHAVSESKPPMKARFEKKNDPIRSKDII